MVYSFKIISLKPADTKFIKTLKGKNDEYRTVKQET